MSRPGFLERLTAGEVLVLDGAVGTELQRRGVPMDSHAWCGIANRSHPGLVVRIHADYIEAGADIITANTFPTARHVLAASGLAGETEALNRAAVMLARRAVDESGRPEVVVAGSMSSMAPLPEWNSTPTGAAAEAAYREQAEILAAAGADLVVAEMMLDADNAALVVEAATSVGLPVLVGWSVSAGAGGVVETYHSDAVVAADPRPFPELLRRGVELGGDVHGVMHSAVEVTGPALEILSEHWRGPTMAYAETGRFDPPDWIFTEDHAPGPYAAQALAWVRSGVQIIGGCCGTTPEHIAALSAALEEA